MAHTQPSIRSGLLSELRDYLSRRGLRFAQLASTSGLKLRSEDDPLQAMSLNATMAVFDEASRLLNDPAFGLKFARELKPGSTGLLGEIVLNAPTVREGLISVAALVSVFMTPFEVEFSEIDGVGEITWSYPSTATAPRVQYNLFIVAVLLHRIRAATQREWVPLAVEIDHTAPDCPDEILAVMGPRTRFNASRNRFLLDASTLALPMPGASPIRFAMMRALADRLMAEQSELPDIVTRTRSAISALLTSGQADLDNVAARLELSPGALQWRLERAATTFEKELTHERRAQAESLLRDTDRSMTAIAYDLGFSDPSAFTRAAQRWFGMSPRDWRRAQRAPIA